MRASAAACCWLSAVTSACSSRVWCWGGEEERTGVSEMHDAVGLGPQEWQDEDQCFQFRFGKIGNSDNFAILSIDASRNQTRRAELFRKGSKTVVKRSRCVQNGRNLDV